MTKADEKAFYSRQGLEGQAFADGKPFTDGACGSHLMSLGQILGLLPPPPCRILDIGCGTAWTSEFLAKAGYTVTGLDISTDMLRAAARVRPTARLTLLAGDCEAIPTMRSFDAVTCYGSLHHIDDLPAALTNCRRVLRPDGVLILMEPGKGHDDTEISKLAVARYGVTERALPPEDLFTALQTAGYQHIEIIPWLALFSGPFSIPRDRRNWKYRITASLLGHHIADCIQLFRSTTKNAAVIRARP